MRLEPLLVEGEREGGCRGQACHEAAPLNQDVRPGASCELARTSSLTSREQVRDADSAFMQQMINRGWGKQEVERFRRDVMSDSTVRWKTGVEWWFKTRDEHDG